MLLVAAERREVGGVLRHCRDVGRLDWPVEFARAGLVNGQRFVMVANGAGHRRAASAVSVARSRMTAEVVVSTGFCGALDPALRIGEIFVASRIQMAGESIELPLPNTEDAFVSGPLVSVDKVAQTVEEKQLLAAAGARAVEMEAAGVAWGVREWGLPFFCIRSVTDRADEGFFLDFNAARRSDGRFSTARILAQTVLRPRLIPELKELHARATIAAGSLGDFLARCRF